MGSIVERFYAGRPVAESRGTLGKYATRFAQLAERFIAGVTRPARPSIPEAETNPYQYDGPPRVQQRVGRRQSLLHVELGGGGNAVDCFWCLMEVVSACHF